MLLARAALVALAAACARSAATESGPPAVRVDAGATSAPGSVGVTATEPDAVVATPRDASAASFDAAPPLPETILPREAIDGPHELLLEPGRPIFYALPRTTRGPARLVAHLHGMCGPPSYACGKWLGAGTATGVVVCPTGNARCGDSPVGPPSWDAGTWPDLVALMDGDLEASIQKVDAKRPRAFTREGAVLTGYSRGAYAAVPIARRHPGRWPFLVLIEADVAVSAQALRAAGVRAVAFVGGEQGDQIAGMRRSIEALEKDGFPARLFVMKKTGHLYSEDMELVMRDALAFVLSHES